MAWNIMRMADDRPSMSTIDIEDQNAESQLDALIVCHIYAAIPMPSLLRILAPIPELCIAPVYW